ncbi:MAG: c-type cytochrome biogenesis protein CcmI [Polycyclovorans sp.]|mgnify:FL=1|nr:c-type cytochrome biogenesis protein CcmI [Polycyclovorans sp.]
MLILALMALLLLMALLALSRPWWRRDAPGETPQRAAANVAVYRQRVQEIDADAAAGLLDQGSAAQLRDEHAARLLTDAGGAAVPTGAPRRGRLWLSLALVPLLAIGAYAASGRWSLATQIEQARTDPQVATRLALAKGLEQLKLQLKRQPNDAEAWAQLGEVELSRGQPEAAAAAYARATALVPDRGQWWAAEGEALAMAQSQDLRGAPSARFERALTLAPDDPKALFYGGLAAAQAGDYATAAARWRRLKQRDDLPAAVAEVIASGLAEWRGEVDGLDAPSALPAPPPPAAAQSVLTVRLSLAETPKPPPPELNTLTLFARPVGGRMPIAVRRQVVDVDAFPMTLRLSDADAMTPDALLSAAASLELVARLSRGQGVAAQSEDWEALVTVEEGTDRSALTLQLAPRQLP